MPNSPPNPSRATYETAARPGPPSLWQRRASGICLLVLVALALVRSVFFVDETEYALVTQFGQVVQFRAQPGLGFRWPFQSVWRFDRRLQIHAPPAREMLTEDKENLNVEWYVAWRLPDRALVTAELSAAAAKGAAPSPADIDARLERHVRQFLQSVGTAETARSRLEERIQAAVAAEFGRVRMNRILSLDAADRTPLAGLLERVTQSVRQGALEQYGIEVVDVRVKRLGYPESVKPAVFAEIRSERLRVADQYRAEGKSEATKIRSLAELHRDKILSQAERDAARMRGQGEARAIDLANAAHRQDPAFYELLKTLEAYRAMLDDQTTVVLSADSPLLRLLTRGLTPGTTPASPSSSVPSSPSPPASAAPAAPLPSTSTSPAVKRVER